MSLTRQPKKRTSERAIAQNITLRKRQQLARVGPDPVCLRTASIGGLGQKRAKDAVSLRTASIALPVTATEGSNLVPGKDASSAFGRDHRYHRPWHFDLPRHFAMLAQKIRPQRSWRRVSRAGIMAPEATNGGSGAISLQARPALWAQPAMQPSIHLGIEEAAVLALENPVVFVRENN